jgi:hypothetical protein
MAMVKIRKIILYGGLTLASVSAIVLGGGFWVDASVHAAT